MFSWEKILNNCLNDSPSVIEWQSQNELKVSSKNAIKKKFKDFNDLFLEKTNLQQNLRIIDKSVLESIKTDNKTKILPKYEAFLERYQKLDFSRNVFSYIKYEVNDVDKMLNSFFSK